MVMFETFYSCLDFMRDESAVTKYKDLAKEVHENYAVSCLHKGLVANLLILNQISIHKPEINRDLRWAARMLAAPQSCKNLDGKKFEVVNLFYKVITYFISQISQIFLTLTR